MTLKERKEKTMMDELIDKQSLRIVNLIESMLVEFMPVNLRDYRDPLIQQRCREWARRMNFHRRSYPLDEGQSFTYWKGDEPVISFQISDPLFIRDGHSIRVEQSTNHIVHDEKFKNPPAWYGYTK